MINSAGLLGTDPYMNQDSVKLSILQSSLRILLGAIGSNDQQVIIIVIVIIIAIAIVVVVFVIVIVYSIILLVLLVY